MFRKYFYRNTLLVLIELTLFKLTLKSHTQRHTNKYIIIDKCMRPQFFLLLKKCQRDYTQCLIFLCVFIMYVYPICIISYIYFCCN